MYVPYKAWEVFLTDEPNYTSEIVYADTRNEARYKVAKGESITDGLLANDPDLEYIDLGARRLKCVDGLGDEPRKLVIETVMKKEGWSWDTGDEVYTADDLENEDDLKKFESLFDY